MSDQLSRFFHALSPGERQVLQRVTANAQQFPPAHWIRWFCGTVFLGWLEPQRALWLSTTLEQALLQDGQLRWNALDRDEASRSAQLQEALEAARALGLLTGWRNERFSFWPESAERSTWPERNAAHLLSVERSGFRFLGMMSHAVHINGFTPDGRVWCARRAMSKATDPGMLDNVTAGGLPTGESAVLCALRELEEEAGLTGLAPDALLDAGTIRTARAEPQGYHDELLQVFNLVLPVECMPVNRDGEVSEFMCLSPAGVMARMEGGEFTADAAAALSQGLSRLISA